MKTITLNVIKKNRVYFKCTHNNYDVKLLIDDKSINLELGEQELLVDDISVRTKYGTDLIYQLAVDSEIQKIAKNKIVTLCADYNQFLVDACRRLGGRWDASAKAWVFTSLVENEVEELDELYNSKKIVIEITALEDCYSCTAPLTFCGYTIATATGRDSGAVLAENIACLNGDIKSSGSMKNWSTRAIEGSIFRLQIPCLVLEKFIGLEHQHWTCKKI